MEEKRPVFSLRDAAEFVLTADRELTVTEIGEENRDLCWRFSRAFGEAMTRFLMTRVKQAVCIVDGSYWVMAVDKNGPKGVWVVVYIGTSIVRTKDHNIAISVW